MYTQIKTLKKEKGKGIRGILCGYVLASLFVQILLEYLISNIFDIRHLLFIRMVISIPCGLIISNLVVFAILRKVRRIQNDEGLLIQYKRVGIEIIISSAVFSFFIISSAMMFYFLFFIFFSMSFFYLQPLLLFLPFFVRVFLLFNVLLISMSFITMLYIADGSNGFKAIKNMLVFVKNNKKIVFGIILRFYIFISLYIGCIILLISSSWHPFKSSYLLTLIVSLIQIISPFALAYYIADVILGFICLYDNKRIQGLQVMGWKSMYTKLRTMKIARGKGMKVLSYGYILAVLIIQQILISKIFSDVIEVTSFGSLFLLKFVIALFKFIIMNMAIFAILKKVRRKQSNESISAYYFRFLKELILVSLIIAFLETIASSVLPNVDMYSMSNSNNGLSFLIFCVEFFVIKYAVLICILAINFLALYHITDGNSVMDSLKKAFLFLKKNVEMSFIIFFKVILIQLILFIVEISLLWIVAILSLDYVIIDLLNYMQILVVAYLYSDMLLGLNCLYDTKPLHDLQTVDITQINADSLNGV